MTAGGGLVLAALLIIVLVLAVRIAYTAGHAEGWRERDEAASNLRLEDW